MVNPMILIVDDDDALLGCLKEFFEAEGYRVVTAGDGMMAIRMAKESAPSLILMDVNMPVFNGLKALEVLRADPALRRVPVILLTAEPSGRVYPVIEPMPNVSHLKKPASLQDVFSLVQHYLAA